MGQQHKRENGKGIFEGWYFRHQNGKDTIAVIPAFHTSPSGKSSASIQVVTDGRSWQVPVPHGHFRFTRNPLSIEMGPNRFSAQGICLDIRMPGLELQGLLHYGAFSPLASDIMGPFRFLPGMECRHGVLSMGHSVEGILKLNGRKIVFAPGSGYLEMDRGRSFPRTYLWSQCNRFGASRSSIVLAAAEVPLPIGPSFVGCIAAVLHRGQEYRLATYRGASVVWMNPRGILIRQGNMALRADLLEGCPQPLLAPVAGEMTRFVRESAVCRVRYRFQVPGKVAFDFTSRQAAFEWSRLASSASGHP